MPISNHFSFLGPSISGFQMTAFSGFDLVLDTNILCRYWELMFCIFLNFPLSFRDSMAGSILTATILIYIKYIKYLIHFQYQHKFTAEIEKHFCGKKNCFAGNSFIIHIGEDRIKSIFSPRKNEAENERKLNIRNSGKVAFSSYIPWLPVRWNIIWCS